MLPALAGSSAIAIGIKVLVLPLSGHPSVDVLFATQELLDFPALVRKYPGEHLKH